ncbi:DUF6151 family protein [Kiloniella sp.]|uniref:DUF6151 family protein n=1 Tax=Kiloniella sp. TaxID=1938587 RepID=UPI003B019262
MIEVALKCSCGQVEGTAHNISPQTGLRLVCHCDDCQAFANYLGREADILDACGGTDVFQTTPSQIEITKGHDQLRCVRLGPKGLFRWYTDCCKTPVANTINASLPFSGIVHNFMDDKGLRDNNLGPVRFSVMGKFAKDGSPLPRDTHDTFPLSIMLIAIPRMIKNKILGRHKPSPFFDKTGAPVCEPVIHTKD